MNNRSFSALGVLLMVLIGQAFVAAAQEAPTEKPCTTPEYSQFDFWVGNWSVSDSEGVFQGTNRVEKIHNGCAIQENWEGAQGTRGTSYNIFAKRRGQWHQTWVDTNGMLLLLDGGLEEGRMVLRGQMPTPDGSGSAEHEISWKPLPDGRVVQQWRVSTDGGANWRDVFVGFYTRQKN